MIFLLGAAFQSSGFYGVKIGTYSPQYTNTTEEILEAMKKSDFTIVKEENVDKCVEGVKNARTHLCITFPTDYKTQKMEFYVDYSRLNLVYAIVSKISDEITSLSSKISLDATEDILGFISESSNRLEENRNSVQNLRTNADNMQNRLRGIAYSINEMDLQQGTEVLDTVTDDTSNLNQEINAAKNDLDGLTQSFQSIKQELIPTRNEMNNKLTSIALAQISQGCNSNNSRDLSSIINNANFSIELANEKNPSCSLLLTFKINIEKEKNKLNSIIAQMDTIIEYTQSLKERINGLETGLKSDAVTAKQNLIMLSEAKHNLTIELIRMAENTNNSIDIFEDMTRGLTTLTEKFKEIALTDASTVIKPIKTSIKPLSTKKINTLDIIFPAIIVMVMLFVGMLIGNILVMREKTSRAYFRNLILPVRSYVFILGTYLTTILIALVQVGIILIIGLIFFNTQLDFNIIRLLPVIILSVVAFASIGMIIGYLASSEETSTLAAISLSIILLLFSNLIIPIETMEESVGILARFTPFNISEIILRRTMVFGSEVSITDLTMTIVFLLEIALLIAGVWASHNLSVKRDR